MLLYVHMVLVHCLEFCDFLGGVGGWGGVQLFLYS